MNTLMKKLRKNKKGFTLAELLIVVAIIGILLAILIPTFSGALNKAQLTADAANARSNYSEAVVKYLEDNTKLIDITALEVGVTHSTVSRTDGTVTVTHNRSNETLTFTVDPDIFKTTGP